MSAPRVSTDKHLCLRQTAWRREGRYIYRFCPAVFAIFAKTSHGEKSPDNVPSVTMIQLKTMLNCIDNTVPLFQFFAF